MTLPWRRGCVWAAGASALVLVTIIGVVVHAVLTWDPRRPYVKDPRACPQSNVPLSEVTGHFEITIPVDATDVHFSSDVHPLFGEYSLQLSFQTTDSGLQTFLTASGLPQPNQPDTSSTPHVDGPSCGIDPASVRDPRYSADPDLSTSSKSFHREAVVDETDKARPRVVLSASDL
jgi:hypothetical protein